MLDVPTQDVQRAGDACRRSASTLGHGRSRRALDGAGRSVDRIAGRDHLARSLPMAGRRSRLCLRHPGRRADGGDAGWTLLYVFYQATPNRHGPMSRSSLDTGDRNRRALASAASCMARRPTGTSAKPKICFGLTFEGHPQLGEFILHEDWPEGVNPMRRRFRCAAADSRLRAPDPRWQPPTIVDGSRRVRHAGRSGVLGFCRIGAFPAGDGRRGRYPHYPAVLLQIPRCREDCRRPDSRSRSCCLPSAFPAPPPLPMAWPSARRSSRSAASEVPPRAQASAHGARRAGTAAPPRGGDHRHLQLDGARGRDQPGRADRREPASPERRARAAIAICSG